MTVVCKYRRAHIRAVKLAEVLPDVKRSVSERAAAYKSHLLSKTSNQDQATRQVKSMKRLLLLL